MIKTIGLRLIGLLLLALLAGCASPLDRTEQLDQNKLAQLIAKVEQRQQLDVAVPVDPSVIFSATFDATTESLLAVPSLMPAVINAPSQDVVIVIGVLPGANQLQDLSRGMRLSMQLQQFLKNQQFQVSRRLDATAMNNQIQIVLASAVEQ